MGEQAQLGERAEDRRDRDAERKQGRHDTAKGDDQQHQRDRDGDGLSDREILADLTADVGTQSAANPYRDSPIIEVGVSGQQGRCVRRSLSVVAGYPGQDERVRAVAGPQARRARRPVGGDTSQAGVAVQPLRQSLAAGRGGAAADVPVPCAHQEDHVRLAAEFLVEEHLGAA